MVRSNLGGQGGRCRDASYADGTSATWQSMCEERCDLPAGVCASPAEVYIADIGTGPGDVCIDLRITNESEYRAWRTGHNGVKHVDGGIDAGFFGVVNLLGPRLATQRPFDMWWSSHLTFVQLRFAFRHGGRRRSSVTAKGATTCSGGQRSG